MDHAFLHERSPSHIMHIRKSGPDIEADGQIRGWANLKICHPIPGKGREGTQKNKTSLTGVFPRQPIGTSRWLLDLAEIDTSGNVPEVTHALTHRRSHRPRNTAWPFSQRLWGGEEMGIAQGPPDRVPEAPFTRQGNERRPKARNLNGVGVCRQGLQGPPSSAAAAHDGTPNLREAKKGSADSQAIGNSIVNDAGRAAVGQLAGNPCLDEHHLPCPWRVGLVPKQQDPGRGDWDIHQLLEGPVLKREVLAEGRSCLVMAWMAVLPIDHPFPPGSNRARASCRS
jgi:hypothetical protein